MGGRLDPVPHPEPGDPQERQHAAADEDEVAGHAQPLQDRVARGVDERERAGLVVPVVDGVPQLDDAERQQGGEHHPGQADVERPEGNLREPVGPAPRGDEVSQREQGQAYAHHPVDAHHRAVGVVGRQRRADLVVRHDRQVEQEPEHTGAEEVPESDGDQEHHRPPVRERRCAA